MRICWTRRALADLNRVKPFLAPEAAARVVVGLVDGAEILTDNPRLGRMVDTIGATEIRKVLICSDEMRYRVEHGLVVILRICTHAKAGDRLVLWFVLGGLILFAFMGGLRMFERAAIRDIKTLFTWIAALGGLSSALLLLLTGRGGLALSGLLLFGPLLWQQVQAARTGKTPRGRAGPQTGPSPRGAAGSAGADRPPPRSGAMTREEAYQVRLAARRLGSRNPRRASPPDALRRIRTAAAPTGLRRGLIRPAIR